jgi:hypothetical protein
MSAKSRPLPDKPASSVDESGRRVYEGSLSYTKPASNSKVRPEDRPWIGDPIDPNAEDWVGRGATGGLHAWANAHPEAMKGGHSWDPEEERRKIREEFKKTPAGRLRAADDPRWNY